MIEVTRAGGVVPSGSISDSELASPNNSAYRDIGGGARIHNATDATTAGTYVMLNSASVATTAASAGLTVFYLDPAEYAVAGLTTRYSVRAVCLTNTVAPAVTFTVGLYPVTASAGAADVNSITLDTVTTGSTVAFASPNASTRSMGVSGDFAAPVAGYFAVAVAQSGTGTADSRTSVTAQLRVRNT